MPCPRCSARNKNGTQCKNNTCQQYPYCWIHLKSKDGLQIKNSSIPGFGKGLFATKDHRNNQKITDYSAKQVSQNPDPAWRYVLQIGENRFLNSEDKSNFVGRYINDSRGTNKRPNVRFTKGSRIFQKQDRYTVPIVSTKNIKKGDELFLSYGSNFWRAQ